MATEADFIDYVREQADMPGTLTHKKMFGEYALYVDGKVVALACDNSLYLKPTEAARRLLGEVVEASPYPGAKPHFLIDEALDDSELLRRLLTATAAGLPAPKPRTPKRSKR
ncbi:TfoX/Sxy family protein [Luteimonas aquatica]|uniref:TfoX/Sxy family protein n=1 Tax=Luteimonas aquatica TaxID=450364 RepID=UPI001F59BEA8|nr:TfoX/Sxy family protein [Luteimonas aquatica]